MDVLMQNYNLRMQKLAQEFASKQYTDFAVVVQPMLRDFVIPNSNFVSKEDCFHPNLQGHRAMAVSLWNTLFLPSKNKPTNSDPNAPIVCPTDESLIYVN